MMHNLIVLENVLDKILAIDFIRQHALSFKTLSDQCFWETPPIESGQLQASERIHLV
jgi:hypothetical protein